jgi:DNA-binding CsgD family transcriptional regulator
VAAAAQAWLDVLTDQADPASVVAAARGLAALGLTWDGTRLAGQAAVRTPDRKAMTVLLDCARVLQGRPVESRDAAPAGTARRARGAGAELLSEREHEVATLVLAGLTYKQVADRLYISAKTVEHHMARIRQRLGCTDRGELLARLRAMTDDSAKPGSRPGDGSRA